MCEYCKTKIKRPVELMDNFPIMDDFSKNKIGDEEETPKQYIRRCLRKYFLVTEFGNDTEAIIACEISFCPMCGRKLT